MLLFSGYSHAKSACFRPEKHGILIPAMMKQEFLSKTLAKCNKSKWNILRLTATANKVLFISSHIKILSMKWYKTQQFRILLSSKLSPCFITNKGHIYEIVQKTLQEHFERNDFSSSNKTKDDNNDCSYNLLNVTQTITFIMNSNDEQHWASMVPTTSNVGCSPKLKPL